MKNNHKILGTIAFFCLMIFSANTSFAQTSNETQYTVKGIVSDESGPLPGVSIVLQGTKTGTETDFEGSFEFPRALNTGDVLIFSHLGMETKKVTVKSSNAGSIIELNVLMKSDSYNLLGTVS